SEISGDKTRKARSSASEMASQSCLYDHRKIPFRRSAAISDFPFGVRIETRYRQICRRGSSNGFEFCVHGEWRDRRGFRKQRLLDLAVSSYDVCAPMHFFHNNADGTFTDRAAQAGLSSQLGGLNMIQADYNNDGCTDILV